MKSQIILKPCILSFINAKDNQRATLVPFTINVKTKSINMKIYFKF